MPEDYSFRRRNRLKRHFVATSNVLLYCYHGLSDGAKITYQVIDSFDWEDESKTSKGYAFPSVGTIAAIRRVSERTIQRHLKELVAAGLLTRQQRPGHTTILVIEDINEKEVQHYLRLFEGGDRNVTPPPTNLSPEIRQSEKDENIVNEDREEYPKSKHPLAHGDGTRTRWGNAQPKGGLDEEAWAKREYYAGEILRHLGDEHSLGCYRAIAGSCPPQTIFEALSLVKEAARSQQIEKSKGALFVDIVKRLAKSRGIRLPWSNAGAGLSPPDTTGVEAVWR